MSVPYQTPEQPETSPQYQSPQQFEEWLNNQHQQLSAIEAQNPWHSVGKPGSPISYLKLGELQARNPWHLHGHVPVELTPPYHRPLAEMLWKRLLNDRPRRHHVILGPRQVGKTTVLYQTVNHLIANGVEPGRIFWLQVDHPYLLGEDLGRLVEFCIEICAASAERPAFVMLDEIVYAKMWDRWLKTFHDQRRPVRIVAVASASVALRARHAESGVGRWEEHHMPPFDFSEFAQFASQSRNCSTPPPESPSKHDDPWSSQHRPSAQSPLFKVPSEYSFELADSLSDTFENIPQGTTPNAPLSQLWRTFSEIGGFPEIVAEHFSQDTSEQKNDERVSERMRSQKMRAQRMLRREIVGRVLRRDIPEVAEVRDLQDLEKLLYVVADLASKQVSPTDLSRKLGISMPTVNNYLSHFGNAFLIFQIPNYSGSETSVQKRGRKLYFMDWAVRNAVLQHGLPLDLGETDEGYLLENLAASALHSLAVNSGTRLYFWRDAEDTEVDLIYDHPRKPLAFEIGRSAKHSLKGLHALVQKHPKFLHRCYFVSPTSRFLSPSASPNGIGTIPLDQFLMAVGAKTRQEIVQSLSSFS